MPFVAYRRQEFKPKTIDTIALARHICEEYTEQGYNLTLRQLYYQFVARGWIANKQTEYDRLGSIVNDARMAGMLDWDWISDRTRNPESRGHWAHPRDIIRAVAQQFHVDYWEHQRVHVEVWVEKEALAGIVEDVCGPLDVTSLACRGYMSQSEMWTAGQRFVDHIIAGRRVVVLHLGDHDPSGTDMSRDNRDRLSAFIGHHLNIEWDEELDDDGEIWWDILDEKAADMRGDHVDYAAGERPDPVFSLDRIALTIDQVRQYAPPPNPAKMTDSRAGEYIALYGRQSWELDALPPNVLAALITSSIESLRDDSLDEAARHREDRYRERIGDLLRDHGEVLDR